MNREQKKFFLTNERSSKMKKPHLKENPRKSYSCICIYVDIWYMSMYTYSGMQR